MVDLGNSCLLVWWRQAGRDDLHYEVAYKADASSSNEAVHLQQRLKSLSSELVTLRNRLHVSEAGHPPSIPQQHGSSPQQASSGAPAPRAHLAPSKPHNVQDHGPGQQPEPPPPVHSPGQQQAPAAFSTQQGHKDTNKHAGVGQQGIPAPPPHGYSQDVGKVSKTGVSGGGAGHFIKPTACTEVRDLIHLPGPLTEDAVLRTLHARFFSREYFVSTECHCHSSPLTFANMIGPYQTITIRRWIRGSVWKENVGRIFSLFQNPPGPPDRCWSQVSLMNHQIRFSDGPLSAPRVL